MITDSVKETMQQKKHKGIGVCVGVCVGWGGVGEGWSKFEKEVIRQRRESS